MESNVLGTDKGSAGSVPSVCNMSRYVQRPNHAIDGQLSKDGSSLEARNLYDPRPFSVTVGCDEKLEQQSTLVQALCHKRWTMQSPLWMQPIDHCILCTLFMNFARGVSHWCEWVPRIKWCKTLTSEAHRT